MYVCIFATLLMLFDLNITLFIRFLFLVRLQLVCKTKLATQFLVHCVMVNLCHIVESV